jgi:CheY-like chemotaxis protein
MRANPTLRKTPIIMLSASIRDQQRALEAGASYFISKPYEATQVLSAIDSTMREESLT